MCYIWIKIPFYNLSIFSVYDPTEEKKEHENDDFFTTLKKYVDIWPENDIYLVIEKFNSKIGK